MAGDPQINVHFKVDTTMFVSGIEGIVALPKNARIDFVCFFDNINQSLLIINAYYILISENCKLGFQFKYITNTHLPFTKRNFLGLYDFSQTKMNWLVYS